MTTPGDSEARRVYERFRAVFGSAAGRSATYRKRREKPATSTPYGKGRDPLGLADVMAAMTEELGWSSPLAKSELLVSWPQIVGEETAQHAQPVGIEEGVLTVRCDSTAWATQLRLMRTKLTTQLLREFPAAGIEQVRFLGPDAPSWKKGPRSVQGRGPRDTYG